MTIKVVTIQDGMRIECGDYVKVADYYSVLVAKNKEITGLQAVVDSLSGQKEMLQDDLELVSRLLQDSSNATLKLVKDRTELVKAKKVLSDTLTDILGYEQEQSIEMFKLELDADTLSTDMSNLISSLRKEGYSLDDIKGMIRPNIGG